MKIIIAVVVIYASIFSFLSIRNHDLYQTFAWDLGFFDQLLWQASKGNLNFVSTIGNINILGDHFQPIIYLLVPLYWLWDDVRVLLVAQAFLVAVAALPIYLLARRKLKNEFLAVAIAVSYLLFGGTQFTMTNEFHQSAFIPLFLALGLYWVESGKNKRGLVVLFSLLLVREETGFLLSALGIMYLLKRKFQEGSMLLIGGPFVFILLVNVIMPKISSQGKYIHYGYGAMGDTPEEVLTNITTRPQEALKLFVYPDVKRAQMRNALMSFGGLPLLSPFSLIPVLEQYVVRFIDTRNVHRWIDNTHYAASLGPLLAFGTIEGISFMRTDLRFRGLSSRLAWYVVFSSLVMAIVVRSPILSIVKSQLYFTPQWVHNINRLVQEIPADVPVAANNSVAPHLTHRGNVYYPPKVKDAQMIVLDLADGPNKYSPLTYQGMMIFVDDLLQRGWCERKRYDQAVLLERCI